VQCAGDSRLCVQGGAGVRTREAQRRHVLCRAPGGQQLYFTLSTLIKKKKKKILIYKEIQSGAVAKSYMRKGFLIYEDMPKYFPIYEEAVSHI